MFKIENFINRYFQDARPYGNPVTDMSVNCPFCGDTKKHLTISLQKEVCHCFRCDYKASWITLVMDVSGKTYYQAINELYYVPKLSDEDSIISKFRHHQNVLETEGAVSKLPDDFELLADNPSPVARSIMKYVESRGFSMYHARRYNLGMSQLYPMRVIIPVEAGYWQGRSIVPWLHPKYINPRGSARSIIFNAQALEMYDEVVVCEGIFSAMAVGSNAIALIGKEVTKAKQDRILNSNVSKIIVALEQGAYDSMEMFMDKAIAKDKEVVVWRYRTGDPADSVDFDVLQYNLKTRVTLRLEE